MSDDMELAIDPFFESLLRPLTEDERKELERNLINDGKALDSIKVWKGRGVIVDGMNRYPILLANELPFVVEELEFDSREQAAEWIVRNQLGKRNLDRSERQRYVVRLVAREAKRQEEGAKWGTVDRNLGSSPVKERAVEVVAKLAGVSERTVERDIQTHEAMATLPADVRGKIERNEVVSTAGNIVSLSKLPDDQKEQAFDLIRMMNVKSPDSAMDSVAEVLHVVTTQSAKAPEVKQTKKAEKSIDTVEKAIAAIPPLIDEVFAAKGLARSLDKEHCQRAFASFVASWRQVCPRK